MTSTEFIEALRAERRFNQDIVLRYYDLGGRKAATKKGVVIVDGKKVVKR